MLVPAPNIAKSRFIATCLDNGLMFHTCVTCDRTPKIQLLRATRRIAAGFSNRVRLLKPAAQYTTAQTSTLIERN
jgi:hypothetical protein